MREGAVVAAAAVAVQLQLVVAGAAEEDAKAEEAEEAEEAAEAEVCCIARDAERPRLLFATDGRRL